MKTTEFLDLFDRNIQQLEAIETLLNSISFAPLQAWETEHEQVVKRVSKHIRKAKYLRKREEPQQ